MGQLCFIGMVPPPWHDRHLEPVKSLLRSSVLCIVACFAISLAPTLFMYLSQPFHPLPPPRYNNQTCLQTFCPLGGKVDLLKTTSQAFVVMGILRWNGQWWRTGMCGGYSQEFHFRHFKY